MPTTHTSLADALEQAQAEADKYYQLWQSVVSHCNTVADERDRLRAEVNRLNKANRVAGALNRALNAENSRLYADIENLKPDAERYRHLRYTNQNTRVICAVSPDRDRWLTGKALDDAIDDALRGEGEK